MGKDQHVVPNTNGGWDIVGTGNSRATRHTDTKADATNIARNIARNQNSELVIHNRDGQISAKDSHGHDPRNVKG